MAQLVEFGSGDVILSLGCLIITHAIVAIIALAVEGIVGGVILIRFTLQEFSVHLILQDAVHVPITRIIPDPLRAHIHGETVARLLVMLECVGGVVATTPGVAADEADPEIGLRMTDDTFVQGSCCRRFLVGRKGPRGVIFRGRRLGVPAHWAAAASPFLEAGAVEDVLTEDGEEARGFIHAFEADRAGR